MKNVDDQRSGMIIAMLKTAEPESRVAVFRRIGETFCTACGEPVEKNCDCEEGDQDSDDGGAEPP